MADELDYQSNSQLAEERAWSLADELLLNSAPATGGISAISQAVDKMSSQSERDNTRASIAAMLAEKFELTTLKPLLLAIESEATAASAALQCAQQRWQADHGKQAQQFIAWGSEQLGAINDAEQASDLYLNYMDELNQRELDDAPLRQAFASQLNAGQAKPWQVESLLRLADIDQQADRCDQSVAMLRRLSVAIERLPSGVQKDEFLFQQASGFGKCQAFSELLSSVDKSSKGSLDINAKMLAQQVFKQSEFTTGEKLLAKVDEPFIAFQAAETWLNQANGQSLAEQQNLASQFISMIAPELEPGEDAFEAYNLLARHYADQGDGPAAKQAADRAAQQLAQISASRRQDFQDRLESLRRFIN